MARQKKYSTINWNMNINQIGIQLSRFLAQFGRALTPYRQELAGFGLFILCLLVLLNLVGLTGGALPSALGNFTRSLFGWGAIPLTLLLGLFSLKLVSQVLKEEPAPPQYETIIGIELIFIAGLALVHIFSGGDDPLALAQAQGGGGFVGWSLGALLSGLLGKWPTGLVFIIIGLAGLGLLLNLDRGEPALPAPEPLEDWVKPASRPAVTTPARPHPPVESAEMAAEAQSPPKKAKKQPEPKPAMTEEQARQAAVKAAGQRILQLPPVELLAPATAAPEQQANVRYQAQVIEETLLGFGVPAEVVEINRGPTVTQFGVKPGIVTKKLANGMVLEQRVRVSKINSLINDLALALAASPIRIETPVPGRPIVGIEVPNNSISLVSLRGGIESETYQKFKGSLRVTLGKGVGGSIAVIDLAAQPHLLIAGTTGSGKSVCINTIIVNLLMNHSPDTLRLLMIDPKMVELTSYNGIPHLIAPVVTDFEQVSGALAWVTREMERRYKAFAAIGVKNIAGYNKNVEQDEQLPFMVVIIDELADLMMLAADEVERYICRIAQMARATGIHMIIATQRPSTDVVTGLIKANFPARIAFAVSSQIDSRVILDTPGADKLLGKGDMLYMAPDSPKLARLQGCFVSDAEIKNVVQYWQWAYKSAPSPTELSAAGESDGSADKTELPWAGILEETGKDDMLAKAIELVTHSGRASTSFLQRKLGIGYPRASRLIDQLEDQGVISPADSNNARDVLWTETDVELAPAPEDYENED